MSEVFNIKRFWNYFVTDTRNAWNNYGISLLLVAFMPLISFVLVELTSLVATDLLFSENPAMPPMCSATCDVRSIAIVPLLVHPYTAERLSSPTMQPARCFDLVLP